MLTSRSSLRKNRIREKNATSLLGYGGDDAVCVWTQLKELGRNTKKQNVQQITGD
jgi:hypothetical protein